jgi:hypothetical protein
VVDSDRRVAVGVSDHRAVANGRAASAQLVAAVVVSGHPVAVGIALAVEATTVETVQTTTVDGRRMARAVGLPCVVVRRRRLRHVCRRVRVARLSCLAR